MKFGLYVGSRAAATCAGPADPLRIGPLVDELSGGRPFVIREYVRWCGGNTALQRGALTAGGKDRRHVVRPYSWCSTDVRSTKRTARSAGKRPIRPATVHGVNQLGLE